MAYDDNWSENDVGLPFLLSRPPENSSKSFAPLIARSLRGSSLMPMRSSVGLACRLAVASVGRTTSVFDFRRVVDVAPDRCMVEDRFDHCSS